MTARLLFVRHGQTRDNLAGVFQGQRGSGLDDTGRQQIAKLAARLRGRSFAALLASDLERAAESAAILGAALGLTSTLEPALREIDVGGWFGLTAAEAAARFPAEHAAWRAGEDVRRGGGESYSEVAARMEAAARSIAARYPAGDTLVVSHGTAIRCLSARVVGAPAQASRAWPVMENAGVTTLSCEDDELRLLCWNDTAHLG